MSTQDKYVERLCRLICKADNVDPDKESVGCGGVIPRDQHYKLWEARKQIAEAIIEAGWFPSDAWIGK